MEGQITHRLRWRANKMPYREAKDIILAEIASKVMMCESLRSLNLMQKTSAARTIAPRIAASGIWPENIKEPILFWSLST